MLSNSRQHLYAIWVFIVVLFCFVFALETLKISISVPWKFYVNTDNYNFSPTEILSIAQNKTMLYRKTLHCETC